MPVVDYKEVARKSKEKVLNHPSLSEKNREALKRFMNAYNVSYARESIFLNNVVRVLLRTDDIERDMNNPEIINKIFKELKQEYSPATMETVKNVTLRFTRWLNKGQKPLGFLDIKGNKAAQRRTLEPKDMVNWEDGLKLAQHSPSVQLKAALMTQLDCGFRPSEFIDLNYGDVTIKDDMILFNVKGKTGQRIVFAHRCVPYFLRWYDNHPDKRKDSPLWALENVKMSHRIGAPIKNIERYTFRTIQKRFDLLKAKAELDKPIDFYNLRHSSCYLDKIDNLPNDLAAERHGHSVDFFVNTYGRLDIQDKLARVRSHYGSPEEKKQLVKNQVCGRCKAINEPEADFCAVCGVPLSVEQAAKVYAERNKMAEETKTNKEMMRIIINSNPKLKKSWEEHIKAEAKT